MAYEVTDDLISALTREWVATLPEQYPAAERPWRYSFRFRRKMRPILRAARKEEGEKTPAALPRAGRFAAALVAAALLTATVAMAFPDIRERVFRMVRENHEDYTRISYEEVPREGASEEGASEEGVPGEEAAELGFTLYRFSYIPEGFVLKGYTVLDTFHHEVFSNEEGLSIGLNQDRLDGAFAFSYTGSEEEIFLSDVQRAWYVDRPGLQMVYWDDGVYSFNVVTNLSREETIRLAESLEPVEEPFADVRFTPYRAAYHPEGYTPAEALAKKDGYQLRWESRAGGWMTLDQVWVGWDAFADDYDYGKNRWPTSLFVLGGGQVDMLEGPKARSLYWQWGEYSFRLSSDTLSAEELMDVVINLHPAGEKAEVFSPYRMSCVPEGFEQYGYGYSGTVYYESHHTYEEYEDAEHGGFARRDIEVIDFHQERQGGTRYAVDTQGLEVTTFTLEDGRTVRYLTDPPKERTLWTQYAYAVWWEDGGYSFSLWSTLSWEETVKMVEGIRRM